jgi:hypothetical protein
VSIIRLSPRSHRKRLAFGLPRSSTEQMSVTLSPLEMTVGGAASGVEILGSI